MHDNDVKIGMRVEINPPFDGRKGTVIGRFEKLGNYFWCIAVDGESPPKMGESGWFANSFERTTTPAPAEMVQVAKDLKEATGFINWLEETNMEKDTGNSAIGNYEIHCNNAKSFEIKDERNGKTVVLVKCDRTNFESNERGLRLAEFIADAMNKGYTD